MTETFYNWQKEFWNRLNKQMQENFEKQVEFTEQQAKKQMDIMSKQIEKQMEFMNKQTEKQMEFTEQQAQKALESAMKNAEKYLNQDNPTLAMYEFGLARFYKNFLRQ